MLKFFRRKKKPELYPSEGDSLAEGVYNRWSASYLGNRSRDGYAAMRSTIEYFILTAVNDSKTHVVRVVKDIDNPTGTKFSSNYSEDSRIFDRSLSQVTASDILNAYPLSDFEKKYANPRDRFGLRRIGTLDEFVTKMKVGKS